MGFFEEYEKIFKNEIDSINSKKESSKNDDKKELLTRISELEKKFERKEEEKENEC